MSARPAYATPRDPSRRTDGGRVARLAAALGKPLRPWQQQVVDVALERDDAGNLVYEIVLVTVPRQSGKTTLVGPVMLNAAIVNPGARMFYTAQTGKDGRERFKDLAKLISASPLAAVAKFRWSQGDTGLELEPNRSEIKVFSPSEEAIHGETPPLVVLDEIFAYSEALGDALLEGAIIPAQMTLSGRRQVWMISTAGTAESRFMRKWVERGRAGDTPRMAYFEWSLPDGADPYAADELTRFHPAIGHGVTADDLLATGKGMSRAQWLRAFCNQWTEAANPLIDLDVWDSLHADTPAPSRADVALAYEIDFDETAAAVIAAWRDPAGHPHIHTVHRAPGTAWLAPYIRELATSWRPRSIAADDGGPTRRVTAELQRDGLDIHTLGARDASTAAAQLLAAARDRTLGHDGSKTLRLGIANAVLQRSGDTQRFSRHQSQFSAGPIAAATALFAYDYAARPLPKPLVSF